MPVSMLCSQCGSPAERCERCAGALCLRLFCSELHDASCAAVSALPGRESAVMATKRTRSTIERDEDAERLQVEQLVLAITRHRHAGRAALIAGDLDTAVDELWCAHVEARPGRSAGSPLLVSRVVISVPASAALT